MAEGPIGHCGDGGVAVVVSSVNYPVVQQGVGIGLGVVGSVGLVWVLGRRWPAVRVWMAGALCGVVTGVGEALVFDAAGWLSLAVGVVVLPVVGGLVGLGAGALATRRSGEVFSLGAYRLVGVVGKGATGTVFLAHDPQGGRVAVKVLDPRLFADPVSAAVWGAETQTMRRVESPYCVKVLDVIEAPDVHAIVYEFVDGASLRAVLDRSGRLAPPDALTVLAGALEGLAALHREGLVHRDVKPANILVDRSGASKLADFGLVRSVTGDPLRELAGSPAYMSPEQARGEPPSFASDIYSCGAMLFELLTGRPPFSGSVDDVLRQQRAAMPPNVRDLDPDVPIDLASLVQRTLAKDPLARPVSARAFFDELTTCAAASYGPDWRRRSALAAAIGAIGAAGLTTSVLEAGGATHLAARLAELTPSTGSLETAGTTIHTVANSGPSPPAAITHTTRTSGFLAGSGTLSHAAIAAVTLGATIATGAGLAATTPAQTPSPSTTLSASVVKTVSTLCAAQNKAELDLWSPAHSPLDAPPTFALTVANYEAAAMPIYASQQQMRARLAALHASGPDVDILQRLVAAEDGLLKARGHFLHDVLRNFAPTITIDLNTTPALLARNYHTLLEAFLATGRTFLAAGIPACAAPELTEAPGPGLGGEALQSTRIDRYTSACPSIRIEYTYSFEGPPTTGRLTAHTGTVVTPDGRPYDGAGGPIGFTPLPQDVLLMHNSKYAVDAVSCETPAGSRELASFGPQIVLQAADLEPGWASGPHGDNLFDAYRAESIGNPAHACTSGVLAFVAFFNSKNTYIGPDFQFQQGFSVDLGSAAALAPDIATAKAAMAAARSPKFAQCIADALTAQAANPAHVRFVAAPLTPTPRGSDVVSWQFSTPPERGAYTLTIIHVGTGFASMYQGSAGPVSDQRLVTLLESRLRATMLPSTSTRAVTTAGQVGTLRMERSSETDITNGIGKPDATGQASLPDSGQSWRVLGYDCSSAKIPNAIEVNFDAGGPPYCRTAYYVNDKTGALQGFQTVSPEYQTEAGTKVGMSRTDAQHREGRSVKGQKCTGIGLGDQSSTATVFINVGSAPSDSVGSISSNEPGGLAYVFCP